MTFVREGTKARACDAPADADTIYSGSPLFQWLDRQFQCLPGAAHRLQISALGPIVLKKSKMARQQDLREASSSPVPVNDAVLNADRNAAG
jgi:hypothetical protein